MSVSLSFFWFAGLLSVPCYALVTWVSEFQIMCPSSSHEVSCVHFFVITRGVHQNKIIKLLYSLRWELKKAVDCFHLLKYLGVMRHSLSIKCVKSLLTK